MSYSRDEPLLTISGISKKYGPKEVLSGVDVQLRDLHCSDAARTVGQVVAILGPSGCGKSTLLRLIAGLEPPSSGTILLGVDQKPVIRGQVGVVFQSYPVWMHRKVLGNLVTAGEASGMTSATAATRAKEYLTLFGLEADMDKFPAELSGGMRQRLAILRQLMGSEGSGANPSRLLLMDEPFSALDQNNISTVCSMVRMIADLNDDNTLIIVTHDLRAALGVADMIWIMGRDHDESGKPCSGGKIVKSIDLANEGLTWSADLYHNPNFSKLESEISMLYRSL